MATYPGQCTHVSGSNDEKIKPEKQANPEEKKRKKTQREIVENNVGPWIPFLFMVLSILGTAKMMLDSHLESRDSDEVKLSRQATARRMYDAEIAKADAEKASNTLSNAQIVIPSPFPKGE